jgi:cytochrome c-type biogenesis protein CcmH
VRTQDENDHLYQQLKGYLMSPYCPGLTLGSCGSGAAELLRADLHEWVDAGYTRDEIVRYYASTFGEEFLGRPPFRGSAIVVWVAPIVALLLGLVAVTVFIRRASRGKQAASPDQPVAPRPSIDPETEARLEAEVKAHYS